MRLDMWLQLLKDFDSQYFGRRHLAPHKIDIEVDVAVVQLIDNMGLNDALQFLQVDHKPSLWINLTLYGNKQFVVMTVPIRVGALAEYGLILLQTPLLAV